jgi:hypothetical protein
MAFMRLYFNWNFWRCLHCTFYLVQSANTAPTVTIHIITGQPTFVKTCGRGAFSSWKSNILYSFPQPLIHPENDNCNIWQNTEQVECVTQLISKSQSSYCIEFSQFSVNCFCHYHFSSLKTETADFLKILVVSFYNTTQYVISFFVHPIRPIHWYRTREVKCTIK